MVYTITYAGSQRRHARARGPWIILSWGGRVVAAPGWADHKIGHTIGSVLCWLEEKEYRWSVRPTCN